MSAPRTLLIALLCALASACTLIRIDNDADRNGIQADGLITGFVSAGWTANDPILNVDIFQNALVSIDVWKLARLEVGLVGASVGLGPFDAGLGVLFYQARPPNYRWTLTGDELPRDEWVTRPRWCHEHDDDDHDADDDDDGDAHDVGHDHSHPHD